MEARDRYHAACSAALAGSGRGDDDRNLGDAAKTAFRRKALNWLQADLDAWIGRHKFGTFTDQTAAAQAAHARQQNDDLAGVREHAALAQLPVEEGRDWEKLWSEVKRLASLDPLVILNQARMHVSRKQWSKAAETYSHLMKDTPTNSGEVWFEFAAAQLLAGNRQGYRDTCKRMLEGSPKTPKIRGYLLAREALAGRSQEMAGLAWQ
jgi:hypothetical protein